MNPGTVALLVIALILVSGDGSADTAELMLSGSHTVEEHRGAMVVGDAVVTVPAGAAVPGPVYVAGGELTVRGTVAGDVIQLGGTVDVDAGAVIGDELRHVGGTQLVDESATVGRRSRLEVVPVDRGPLAQVVPTALATLLLAAAGARLARRRAAALRNVSDAILHHPLISLTVGTLLTLTSIALGVFMAFTLVLIPVAAAGLVLGLATLGYGIIVWGHLLGRRFAGIGAGRATALGVVAVVVLLQVAGAVPLLGDLAVFGVLLSGVGAVVLTYYGVSPFQPATFPDAPPGSRSDYAAPPSDFAG